MFGSSESNGFLKFVDRDEWARRFGEVLEDHVGTTLELLGLNLEELGEKLGPDVNQALWALAFEDMLTREFADDGNVVNVYLKRRGWKESVRFKTHLKVMRHSVLSLYEISEVALGKSLKVRDLIRGGEPILISDGEAAEIGLAGEQVAVRIIRIGDKNIFGGVVIPFSPEMTERLLADLHVVFGKEESTELTISDEDLRDMAFIFTEAWLEDMLGIGLDDDDEEDGPVGDLLLHEVSFPLAAGVTQKKVAEKLDAVDGMVRLRHRMWAWQDDLEPGAPSSIDFLSEDGREPTVSMEGRFLKITASSADKADECEKKMRRILGDLAGEPQRSTQNILDILQGVLAGVGENEALPAERSATRKPAIHDEGEDKPASSDLPTLDDIRAARKNKAQLSAAQNIIYDAWEADDDRNCVVLAKKALAKTPLCADAWVLLAGVAETDEERLNLCRRGVEAGERAIGKADFEEMTGDFWGFHETRPYMRARAALAGTLWGLGQRAEAVAHYRDMLRLNPGDNQGIRYVLASCLLEMDDIKALKTLFRQYDDDDAAAWLYTRALVAFHAKDKDADTLARQAREANKFVPAMLAGAKKPKPSRDGFMTLGGEDEATEYVEENGAAWHRMPGAVEWLLGATGGKAAPVRKKPSQ